MNPETNTPRSAAPPRVGLRRILGGLSALLLLATLAVIGAPPFGTSPAGAATENKLPKSTVTVEYDETFKENTGDVPMPDCGTWNLEGRRGHAKWSVTSSLGSGSKVYPGSEWDIKVSMYVDNLDANQWSYNDGPDPLILWLEPGGPVEAVSRVGVLPANLGVHDAYHGESWVGPKGGISDWGYAFDSNSEPKLDGILIETSDGVDLTYTMKVRATQAGTVTLPKFEISGWDSTPKAAEIGCSIPLDWSWTVVQMDKPVVVSESVSTDASYAADTDDDANGGQHGIAIDVLKNDRDGNGNASAGDLSKIRISNYQTLSDHGGLVTCAGGLIGIDDDPENFPLLATGPCYYSPPQNYSGPDKFSYTVRQNSTQAETDGVVNINVVANPRPATIDAELYGYTNTDDDFSVKPFTGDPQGEAVSCQTDLVSQPAPVYGTVTMNADCTFHWDANGNDDGAVTFGYRVCDNHKLLTSIGTNATKDGTYNFGEPEDLSATNSRRCADGVAKLIIGKGMILPPVGVTDVEVVDSGYAADDIGAYTVAIPVLDNDFDHNGPDPTTFEVLDGPEPTEGTATKIGNRIFFTPADGFSGPVKFTYRVCENPDLQTPPYQGFPFCGVGQVLVYVISNNAPKLADDAAFLFPNQVIDDLDIGENDSDIDGENLTCSTDPVSVSDPAKVSTMSITSDCLLDLDAVDGAKGSIEVTYEACDDHTLMSPLNPAPIYGADDRHPGDVASRCSTAVVTIALLDYFVIDIPDDKPEIEPGPTDDNPDPAGEGEDPSGEDDGTDNENGGGQDGDGDGTDNTGGNGNGTDNTGGTNGTGTNGTGSNTGTTTATGSLPVTGADTLTIVSLGMVLLAGGAALTLIARRRNDER